MLVIIVGGIPIAMPTVLSVTLALGAFKLAKEGAIVARMSAVEEMAGAWASRQAGHGSYVFMFLSWLQLCSDKDSEELSFEGDDAVKGRLRQGTDVKGSFEPGLLP